MRSGLPDPVRQSALWILLRTERRRSSVDGPLRAAAASFEDRDRRFLWMLVQETVRWRARLDEILRPLVRRPPERLDASVRAILRLAACQACCLDQVPDHAIVDEAVRLAQQSAPPGADRFVNAVSRRLVADGRARWALLDATDDPSVWPIRLSHPYWLVERWRRRLGEAQTRAILEWDNGRAPIWLRARPGGPVPPGKAGWVPNTYQMPEDYRPSQDPMFENGDWTVQDPSEALVGLLPPDGSPVSPILDLCAAPGTKTSHLCERYGERVIAVDRTRLRVRQMRDTMQRTRGAAQLVVADALQSPFVEGSADGILVDAPCSNLGVLRRRVDARWNVLEGNLGNLARLQLRLLHAAARLSRPGAWLLYSVCSTEPEETDEVREAFLRSWPQVRPIPFAVTLPQAFSPAEGILRILPGQGDCDGVYACLFERAGVRA